MKLPFRTRLDFFVICYAFAIFVGAWGSFFYSGRWPHPTLHRIYSVNAFALLTGQLFRPYGYSDTQSGLFVSYFWHFLYNPIYSVWQGACLLLVRKTDQPGFYHPNNLSDRISLIGCNFASLRSSIYKVYHDQSQSLCICLGRCLVGSFSTRLVSSLIWMLFSQAKFDMGELVIFHLFSKTM